MQKYTNLVTRLREKLQNINVFDEKPNETKPEEIKKEVVVEQKQVSNSIPTKNSRKKRGAKK